MGQTCFMNATLQCLAHHPVLREFLHELTPEQTADRAWLADLKKITEGICSSQQRPAIKPRSLVESMSKMGLSFKKGEHGDAHEWCHGLLTCVHADCVRTQTDGRSSQDRRTVTDTTAVYDIFGGTQLSTLKCMECGEESQTRTPFLDLSLPISNDVHAVEDGLKQYMRCEKLGLTEGWRCPVCKQVTTTTKQLLIETAPEGLILHLERFRRDAHTTVKLDTPLPTNTSWLSPPLQAMLATSSRGWYVTQAVHGLAVTTMHTCVSRGEPGSKPTTTTCLLST